jgi:hypothetical protein
MDKLSIIEFLIAAIFLTIGLGVFIYYAHKTDELFKDKDEELK